MSNGKLLSISAVIIAILAIVMSIIAFRIASPQAKTGASTTAYDRVMASGTIRCGYVPYPPGLIKNPNTGKISGVFADAIQEAATNLGLKVDWAEEVGWGSMIEGLKAGRYDMICSPVWANSTRARFADFTTPLFYSGIDAYVRAGDVRFLKGLSLADAASVRMATIDGEMSAIISAHDFPKAQTLSLPQTADDSQLLLNVASGKADITFVEPYIAGLFLKSHPGSIVNITPENPLRIFPNTMMINKGDEQLKSMLNVALNELLNSGEVDILLRKYAGEERSFYPVTHPYRVQ